MHIEHVDTDRYIYTLCAEDNIGTPKSCDAYLVDNTLNLHKDRKLREVDDMLELKEKNTKFTIPPTMPIPMPSPDAPWKHFTYDDVFWNTYVRIPLDI